VPTICTAPVGEINGGIRMRIIETKYSGIWITDETDDGNGWWISDANGGQSEYFASRPTPADVDTYREEAVRIGVAA